jgi:hypothetical protein
MIPRTQRVNLSKFDVSPMAFLAEGFGLFVGIKRSRMERNADVVSKVNFLLKMIAMRNFRPPKETTRL